MFGLRTENNHRTAQTCKATYWYTLLSQQGIKGVIGPPGNKGDKGQKGGKGSEGAGPQGEKGYPVGSIIQPYTFSGFLGQISIKLLGYKTLVLIRNECVILGHNI